MPIFSRSKNSSKSLLLEKRDAPILEVARKLMGNSSLAFEKMRLCKYQKKQKTNNKIDFKN